MRTYRLEHLGDATLLRDLAALVAQERTAMAAVLAHIAEVDARKLYLPAGYPSMHAYCVGELRFSEDATYKRIQAGRAARQFPAIFGAVAEGRLHLTAVNRLAPYLTQQNADGLIEAAAGKSKLEIEQLLSQQFPDPEPPIIAQASAPAPREQLVPEPVDATRLVPEPVVLKEPPPVSDLARRPASPPASRRFDLRVSIEQGTCDKLAHAQNLLGHAVRYGDVAQVLDRALDALIERLEKQKFAATNRPRQAARRSEHPRTIPAHVRRAVQARDGGQCAFVSEDGRRCTSRRGLQFDHVEPVARGGRATVDNIRLLCREHNQYEAERVFGAGFMQAKRDQARLEHCERLHDATLEERVRAPLSSCGRS